MLKKAIQLTAKTSNTSYGKPEQKKAIKVLLKLQ